MSRCTVKTKIEGTHLEVGLDQAGTPRASWFGHAYNDGEEKPVDSLWSTRSNGELCAWMRKHGVDLDDEYTAKVFHDIGGDLDPGDTPSPGSEASA